MPTKVITMVGENANQRAHKWNNSILVQHISMEINEITLFWSHIYAWNYILPVNSKIAGSSDAENMICRMSAGESYYILVVLNTSAMFKCNNSCLIQYTCNKLHNMWCNRGWVWTRIILFSDNHFKTVLLTYCANFSMKYSLCYHFTRFL